jgi:hypothetical protein
VTIQQLLAVNIRADRGGDDSELIDSLRRFGWNQKLPAIKDEHGVVLTGHRRLRIAKRLGIEPVIEILTLGDGEAADAERVKLAMVSNIGGKPMTAKDRQRIAQHLYGGKRWTIERIAEALDVGKSTVARDLDSFPTAGKPDRPKGGRPKGSKKSGARKRLRLANGHADEPDPVPTPEDFRDAFLGRNAAARENAYYVGPFPPGWGKRFATVARDTANRWLQLADSLEQEQAHAPEEAD